MGRSSLGLGSHVEEGITGRHVPEGCCGRCREYTRGISGQEGRDSVDGVDDEVGEVIS